MTAQAPAALGQGSKPASVWDPPRAAPGATEAEPALSRAVRIRAGLLGLALGALVLAAATAAALLLVAVLFDATPGSIA